MSLLIVQAYLRLLHFHLYLVRGDFSALYERVRKSKVNNVPPIPDGVERICAAADMACIWYPKQVLCLQRSAATVCLLRAHGFPAHLVLGAQKLPFRAHAWVEVEGRVISDHDYVPEIYAVLDRC